MFFLQGCGPSTYVVASSDYRQEQTYPDWAPQYDNPGQVSYYYMPDIETYYDVRGHQFIYYDNGAWIYSSHISPMYSSYDLNNSYVVVLDYNVHEPWRNHQDYHSHYPAYYYQTENVNNTTIINNNYGTAGSGQTSRGYNENAKTPIYRTTNNQSTRRPASTASASNQNEPSTRRPANSETINNPTKQDNHRRENENQGFSPGISNQPNNNVNTGPAKKPEPQTERRVENNRPEPRTNTYDQPQRRVNTEPNVKQDNQGVRRNGYSPEKTEPAPVIKSEPSRRLEPPKNIVQPARKDDKQPVRKEDPKEDDKKKKEDRRR
jgi:hypothetical protein